MRLSRFLQAFSMIGALAALGRASPAETVSPQTLAPEQLAAFIDRRCADCHDGETKKAGLDLTALGFKPADSRNFSKWVLVHDRVLADEMPPKKQPRPETGEALAFLRSLEGMLNEADRQQLADEGRATLRRLNRYEYENTVRDLLSAPWLQLREMLPEDGEAYRYNKIGDALDVSHVQMARYMAAADRALRQVMMAESVRRPTVTTRYYSRDQPSFTGKMAFNVMNMEPERATFPVLGTHGQPAVRQGWLPITAGFNDLAVRDAEAMAVVAGSYEPVEVYFEKFEAPVSGFYRLKFKAYPVWVGAGQGKKWMIPDLDAVSVGHRDEPITVYAEAPIRQLRTLGAFDITPEGSVREIDTYLLAKETIRPDAARLYRPRPGVVRHNNPLATPEGQPGVAFNWLEVEGPIYPEWPTAGYKLLFGDLPVRPGPKGEDTMEVISTDLTADALRLLRQFVARAYRRPVVESDVERFLPVVQDALATGAGFADAMISGYTAVLCSPAFLYLEQKPGRLDDFALASRLSYFLWNTAPDDELRALAAENRLHDSAVLRSQADRMLADSRSQHFINAFLAYWLQLRKLQVNSPDELLYNDYYLDDLLTESAEAETRSFLSELVRGDLPARNLVSSDFVMVNERLANHYGIEGVKGVAIRRVPLPMDSPRGGLMTQASVLKVTANGTTTSPVLRGAWVMERILGQPVPPPPPDIPAIEPDTRGAKTIREILDKHRNQTSCAGCHAKIDPAGFALESFDVMGGWRDRYRALGATEASTSGRGHNGQPLAFHTALPVDSSGHLPDGRTFTDVRALKQLLLTNEPQIARNLVRQLVTYATGAPVRFSERPAIESILQRSADREYGVRTLIREIVTSDLFLEK